VRTTARYTFALLLAAFVAALGTSLAPAASGTSSAPRSFSRGDVTVTRIADGVWVVTSWALYDGVRTPANGLLVTTGAGTVLVDTPWNDANTSTLLALAKRVSPRPVKLALITHTHPDRIGGIRTLLRRHIRVWSTKKTADLAAAAGYPRPAPKLKAVSTSIRFGSTTLVSYFPGEGHSVDNIVVWLPATRVLFAGCLVKEKAATSIGNTADANLKQWPATLRRLEAKFPQARIVVPGHGRWGDRSLIEHTLALLGA
jgi:metallo-beta-lactamase class B